jgi:hypothetical protein
VTARSRSSPLLAMMRSNGDGLAPKIAQSVFCTSQGQFRSHKIVHICNDSCNRNSKCHDLFQHIRHAPRRNES